MPGSACAQKMADGGGVELLHLHQFGVVVPAIQLQSHAIGIGAFDSRTDVDVSATATAVIVKSLLLEKMLAFPALADRACSLNQSVRPKFREHIF